MAPRVVAIVQARLGSSRLPGKALLPIAGRTMLEHVLRRILAVSGVDEVVLATTVSPEDDGLEKVAASLGVSTFRGSVKDVLGRFHSALRAHPADAIVRGTADCPLLDPEVSGRVVADYVAHLNDVDYVSNVEPPTYPDGLDTEIMSAAALDLAWREADLPSDREHVTTYIRSRKDDFRIRNVEYPGANLSGHRWTVDEPRDLDFVRAIYNQLGDGRRMFGMHDVLALLEQRPELLALNSGIARNEGLERSRRLDRLATKGGADA